MCAAVMSNSFLGQNPNAKQLQLVAIVVMFSCYSAAQRRLGHSKI